MPEANQESAIHEIPASASVGAPGLDRMADRIAAISKTNPPAKLSAIAGRSSIQLGRLAGS